MIVELPMELGDGRLDGLLRLFATISRARALVVDWTRVSTITPAGQAILACLADHAIEQGCTLEMIHVPRFAVGLPAVKLISAEHRSTALAHPDRYNIRSKEVILAGGASALLPTFPDAVDEIFAEQVSEESLFAARIILNELMMNAVDHSGAERYYLYAGLCEQELHIGALDMGVTVPAKLKQRYPERPDEAFIEFALEQGTTTRRTRPGGMGLFLTVETLKDFDGRLTILSARGSVRRYFKRRKADVKKSRYPVPGTWCFARLNVR